MVHFCIVQVSVPIILFADARYIKMFYKNIILCIFVAVYWQSVFLDREQMK